MQGYFLENRQPITEAIYFADLPPEAIIAALKEREKKYATWQATKSSSIIEPTLEKALDHLPALRSSDESYLLLVPTESKWTAVFESVGKLGSDVNTTPAIISRFGVCKVCVATAARDTSKEHRKEKTARLSYGSTRFDLLDKGEYIRNIQSMNEGTGRWVFNLSGTPLLHENKAAYQNRLIKERFSVDDLNFVLFQNFGIRYRDLNFYRPELGCLLVHQRLKILGLF